VTTGEFFSLSMAERKALIDFATKADRLSFQVGIGCGDSSTAACCELARYAQDRGASFILALPPYYLATGERNIACHLLSVLNSTTLPSIIYDGGGGVSVPAHLLAQISSLNSNVVGVKVAQPTVAKVAEILSVSNRLKVYAGEDHLLASALFMGAEGACIAGSSLQPHAVSEIIDLASSGKTDEALAVHSERLLPQWAATGINKSEFVPAFKLALNEMKVIQTSTVRPPLLQLSEKRQQEVRNMLGYLNLV